MRTDTAWTDPFAHGGGAEARTWVREIALCCGLVALLVLDIGALGCEAGFTALDPIAVHLWAPGP